MDSNGERVTSSRIYEVNWSIYIWFYLKLSLNLLIIIGKISLFGYK